MDSDRRRVLGSNRSVRGRLKIGGLQGSSPILVSADFGSAWSVLGSPSENWVGVALSSDGNRLVATVGGGGIYTWQPTVPVIASQPQSQTTLGGLTGTLDAGVFSTVPLTYQWQFDGTNVVGGTDATLAITDLNPSDSGAYTVLVSNSYGATVSSNATITVVPAFVSTLSTDWGISDAILGGSVSTGSNSTVVWFNWGADTNYGNATPAFPVPDGVVSLNFSNRITGLASLHNLSLPSRRLKCAGRRVRRRRHLYHHASLCPDKRHQRKLGLNGLVHKRRHNIRFLKRRALPIHKFRRGLASNQPHSIDDLHPLRRRHQVGGFGGSVLYLTTNSGAKWSSNTTPTNFSTFAASDDLTKLVAIGGSQIYLSTNTGGTWTLSSAPSENWASVASSADGSEFVALAVESESQFGGFSTAFVYLSTNSGVTWSNIAYFADEFRFLDCLLGRRRNAARCSPSFQ